MEPLEKAPFRTELGERIHREVCRQCWTEWLEHQTLLINHYGLDPREKKARDFLYGQIEEVLLGGGSGMNPAGEGLPDGRLPEG